MADKQPRSRLQLVSNNTDLKSLPPCEQWPPILLAAMQVGFMATGIDRAIPAGWPALRRMIEAAEAVIVDLGYDDESVEAYNRAADKAAGEV